MLTVASPHLDEIQVSLRADQVAQAIRQLRAGTDSGRATLVYNFPASISSASAVRPTTLYLQHAVATGVFRDARLLEGPQFVGVDGITTLADSAILADLRDFVERRLRIAELHPDAWQPVVIRNVADTRASCSPRLGTSTAIASWKSSPTSCSAPSRR